MADNTPTGYTSPETAARARTALSLIQAKLMGAGIESNVGVNWYFHSLIVIDPETYRALEVRESQESRDRLIFCFETIRVTRDGEILYRGPTIEEDIENLDDELMAEIQRQHDWVTRAIPRRVALREEEANRHQTLQRLNDEFPQYRGGINCYVKIGSGVRFSVTLQDLTEYQLRTFLQMMISGSVPEEDPLVDLRIQMAKPVVRIAPVHEPHDYMQCSKCGGQLENYDDRNIRCLNKDCPDHIPDSVALSGALND